MAVGEERLMVTHYPSSSISFSSLLMLWKRYGYFLGSIGRCPGSATGRRKRRQMRSSFFEEILILRRRPQQTEEIHV